MRDAMCRVLAAAAALVLGAACARAEPVKVRVGFAVVPANLFPLFAETPGVAQHLGKSYTIELTRFAGTPQQMAGFAADEIDMGSFSFSTLAIAIQNAGIEDARIIADMLQDGAHGSNSNELMVLKDGPIHTIDDLRGKVFATIGAGGSSDMAMRMMLRSHGMDDKTALTYVEVGFPNMKAMLLEHKVDIITAVTPFSQDPELRANARTLFRQADVLGPTSLLMLAARAGFITKNRAAVVDFLEDDLRMVRWYTDPANRATALDIVARLTKRPASFYDSRAFTKEGDQYRAPDGLPDVAGVQKGVELARQFGVIKSAIDAKAYFDLSMVKEAAARLN